jgi:beta-lactamase superfamily II metal-dependent hydrolase
VLRAFPHHGSRTANPRELAGWAKPRWVVVSTSDRDAELRLTETYDGTADVLSTATRGTVGFQIDPAGEMTVETFRGE